MSERFSGKVVLVTGGTGGLGRAVTLAFLEADAATVIVTHRNPDELDALKRIAGDAAVSRLDGRRQDVTDSISVRSFIDGIYTRYGRLDAMVNTVGGYTGGPPLWETDEKAFDQMLLL